MRSLIKFIDQGALYFILLILSDAIFISVSFFLSFFIRELWTNYHQGLTDLQPLEIYIRFLPIVLFLFFIVFYFFELYERKSRLQAFSEIVLTIKALSFCMLLIMSVSFLQKYDYSRIFILLFWILGIVFINLGRFILRKGQKYFYRKGLWLKHVLIIGAGKLGKNIAENLENYKDFGYKIIGFIDDQTRPKNEKYKFFGDTTNLQKVIKHEKINYVFIADPSISHERILNMIQESEGMDVNFKVVSDLFEIITGGMDIDDIEEIPSIDLSKNNSKKVYEFFKRIMDIFLGTIFLIISLPFSLLIIILIKLDTKGPSIFIQKRVGHNGRIFEMYKFRTMSKDTDEYAFAPKKQNDSRITRIGKFLRKTSLDELPQLINVIGGEMSLVGPRPEMPFIVERYKSWQKRRLDVKPGLTGLWQILGRKDLPLHENLEYDFYYIKNRSLILDIVILFKTVTAVIFQKGAY